MGYINKVAGAFLVLVGILIITNSLNVISEKALSLFGQ